MQAFESACLSLTEFRQRSGFADACESSRPRRKDVADALKTAFWAFSLQARTGLETAYALERHFEPEAFGRTASGERFHKNKWRSYLAGRHQPKDVLNAVEAKCPGANACLTSPLWAALAPRPLTRPELETLVLPLAPAIQSWVRRRGITQPRPRSPRVGFSTQLAKVLQRRPSLDALAAAVIMVRVAHVEGEVLTAYQWARLALRLALLQVELLYAGGIFRPLIELLDERVLTLASHGGTRPCFPAHRFEELSQSYAQFKGLNMGAPAGAA
jgi:hypothetical protein